MAEKKNFKYNVEITRYGLFNDFLEFYKDNEYGIEITAPRNLNNIRSSAIFKIENNAENIAILLTKGKNEKNHYKERLEIRAKDYLRDSGLINDILYDLK